MRWWPFPRRKPSPPGGKNPPAAQGDSIEDWQAGDIAECVFSGPWLYFGIPMAGPERGNMVKVSEVHLNGAKQYLLLSPRYPETHWYAASEFRKVRPGADKIERADVGFVTLLERHKPKVTQT
jgi:hypothetical protein